MMRRGRLPEVRPETSTWTPAESYPSVVRDRGRGTNVGGVHPTGQKFTVSAVDDSNRTCCGSFMGF